MADSSTLDIDHFNPEMDNEELSKFEQAFKEAFLSTLRRELTEYSLQIIENPNEKINGERLGMGLRISRDPDSLSKKKCSAFAEQMASAFLNERPYHKLVVDFSEWKVSLSSINTVDISCYIHAQ